MTLSPIVGDVFIGSVQVRIKRHALERYVERVKPALDNDAALADLQRVARLGHIGPAPDWLHERFDGPSLAESCTKWLYLCDDIALPLLPSDKVAGGWLAVTCVTRTGISDESRAHRARIRASHGRQFHRRGLPDPPARSAWRREVDEQMEAA